MARSLSDLAAYRRRATAALGLRRPCRRCQVRGPAPSRRDRIRSMLADLRMPGALEAVDGILSCLDSGSLTGPEAIEALLSAQIELRNNRRLQAAMRSSRLPAIKTLEGFDFSFQPSIRREQIESLHELGFVERRENVIFLGPPGVGKTHLAISLAIAAAQRAARLLRHALRSHHPPRGGPDRRQARPAHEDAHVSGRPRRRRDRLPAREPHRRHALLLCDSIQMVLVYSRGAGRLTLSSSAVRGCRWTCRRPAILGVSL